MKLFVGLGNPGERHARQRHNVGFMAVERIARRHGFGPWRARFAGQLAEGRLDGERVWLLKPQTFMNESGRAVAEAVRFYKLPPEALVVLHDEIDLVPGKVRVKQGGGVAGHNGLRSLADWLGTKDFIRVRIGIGHPGHKERVIGHVLADFAKSEQAWLEPLLDAVADAAPLLARSDDSGFMNRVAVLTRPPKPAKAAVAAKDGAGDLA
jgi:PTH1 family peptidyl-tRNA hydrolase